MLIKRSGSAKRMATPSTADTKMPTQQPLYRREIELLSQGRSPTEISHLANLLEHAINPLVCMLSGGTLDLSALLIAEETPLVPRAAFIFRSVLTSDQAVIVPNRAQWWYVQNATVGAFALKIRTPSGPLSSPIPPNAAWQLVQCDGKNEILLSPPHIYQRVSSSREWFGPDQK